MTLPTVPPTMGDMLDVITDWYGCTPAEREEMRRVSLRDPDGAAVCYRALYDEIQAKRAAP